MYDINRTKQNIQKKIDRCKISVAIVDWLYDFTKKNDGTKNTHELVEEMRFAFPDYNIYATREFGFYYLVAEQFKIYLAFKDVEEKITHDKIKEATKTIYFDRDRLPKYMESLNSVNYFVERINYANEQIGQVLKESRAFGIEDCFA